jgi:hypothetical protein
MQILRYLWHFIEKSGQIPAVPEGPDTYTGRFMRVRYSAFRVCHLSNPSVYNPGDHGKH